MRRTLIAALLVLNVLLPLGTRAELRMPGVFSDHMVLQREQPLAVWGWAAPGTAISVNLADNTTDTRADASGAWRATLAPLPAGGPYRMIVRGDGDLIFQDVMIGEVWLCSGQSNMEFPLATSYDPLAVAHATNGMIRQLLIPHAAARAPTNDIALVNGSKVSWVPADPATAGGFTAVGYYFAERLQAELGCAVGLIKCAWGGTAIKTWTPRFAIEQAPTNHPMRLSFDRTLERYQRALTNAVNPLQQWLTDARAAQNEGQLMPDLPPLPVHPLLGNEMAPNSGYCNLFQGMVAPVIPLTLRGIIWYQGETDAAARLDYLPMMEIMVSGWRTAWGKPDLPFYYVQLASFLAPPTSPAGGTEWAFLREAQRRALQTIPHSGMAVTIDIGAATDIHPRNKTDVGRRLAAWPLHDLYGFDDLSPSGPLYRETVREGSALRVTFSHAESGLTAGRIPEPGHFEALPQAELGGFAIAGEDRIWHWATARIEGETVVVSCPEVPAPVAVRYAFDNNPVKANLYHLGGLPASPFRSDDWAP